MAAFPALAAGGYEAMLVNYIDPRFKTGSWAYMAGHGYNDDVTRVVGLSHRDCGAATVSRRRAPFVAP